MFNLRPCFLSAPKKIKTESRGWKVVQGIYESIKQGTKQHND